MIESKKMKGYSTMERYDTRKIFRDFASKWPKDAPYYVWGASNTAKELCTTFHDLNIVGFVDNDAKKWGTQFRGRPVLSPDAFFAARGEVQCIVASIEKGDILAGLKQHGLRNDLDACGMDRYIGIHHYLDTGELRFARGSLLITSFCSLNCRNCCLQVPYYKRHQHRSIDDVLADADHYFRWVDHVMWFDLIGGEPFVHPDVDEITERIAKKYRSRMGALHFVTNGTILPSDRMLELMKQYGIAVEISDYRKAVPAIRDKVGRLTQTLESRGITYHIVPNDTWIDWNYLPEDRSGWDARRLSAYCRDCGTVCQGIYDGKFYYCYQQVGSNLAETCPSEPGDYFDATGPVTPERKGELLAFNLDCAPKGYESYCRHCAGWRAVNPRIVPAGEQLPRPPRREGE